MTRDGRPKNGTRGPGRTGWPETIGQGRWMSSHVLLHRCEGHCDLIGCNLVLYVGTDCLDSECPQGRAPHDSRVEFVSVARASLAGLSMA